MSLAIAQPRQLNQFESTEIPGKFGLGSDTTIMPQIPGG
jgi:hypothetical protein